MPKATQMNLKLENKIGTLAVLCRDLAHRGVNLLAISAPETDAKTGPIRLLVTNPELAEHALTKAGYKFVTEQVLYLELKNRPGALAKAVEKLAKANIDVRYAYATAYTKAQKTAAVIAVDEEELDRAVKLFR
jgi:hypothetical protein